VGRLIDELIPNYLISDENNKTKIGPEIFNIVLRLRMLGFIKDNPNSQKQLAFYKDENSRLRVM
jgi:hypothetical protein